MKKRFKQLLVAVLALTMVLTGALCVQAKTIQQFDLTYTLYPSKTKNYNFSRKAYAPANEYYFGTGSPKNKGVSSYRSSNTSVLDIVFRKAYSPGPDSDSYKGSFIKVKKPGISFASYKVGGITYKNKVTVKKYVNPFSTLKIGSLNLTSKFNKAANYTLSYDKYKNKMLKLQIKRKKGWVSHGIFYLEDPKVDPYGTNIEEEKSFKVTKRNTALRVCVINSKTTQLEDILIFFK